MTRTNHDLGVVFAGGGTGGHIFPAIAVYESLREQTQGDIRAFFVCSDRPLDAEILRREGLDFVRAPARPLIPTARGLLALARSWGPTVRLGRAHIRDLQASCRSVVLVAFGGFVAPAMVQSARAQRVLRLLVNLDAVPGRASRWCASRVHRVLSVHEHAGWETIDPIVRTAATFGGDARQARTLLGLEAERRTLLIVGGSQGASSIDAMIEHMLAGELGEILRSWQVIHQARPEHVERLRLAYQGAGVRAHVVPFIEQMGAAWVSADLALARGGAGTVSEVRASRVPAVFMPYPGHGDGHQHKNAQVLKDAGGAIVCEDVRDPAGNSARAGAALMDLLRDEPGRAQMREHLGRLGASRGSDQVARAILEMSAGAGSPRR